MSLVDVRAEIISHAARFVSERLRSPHQFVLRQNTTIQSALDRDHKEGNYREAANEGYSIYLLANNPNESTRGFFLAVQELINLGDFRTARRLLSTEAPTLIDQLEEDSQRFYKAKVQDQFGWIDDYQLNYRSSLKRFSTVREILSSPTASQNTNEQMQAEAVLRSTSHHFSGRGHFGLASQKIEPEINLAQARVHFQTALELDTRALDEEKTEIRKLAFGHAWLARCYLKEKNLEQAREEAQTSARLFDQDYARSQRPGSIAHPNIIRAIIDLKSGDTESALVRARLAKTLWSPYPQNFDTEPYPKGFADASLLIGYIHLRRGNIKLALDNFYQGFRTYPASLIRGVIGA